LIYYKDEALWDTIASTGRDETTDDWNQSLVSTTIVCGTPQRSTWGHAKRLNTWF
jgi:hypothetical protein